MTHFNESEIRGIDFAVRVTAKSFPFIKGWQFSDYHIKNYTETFPILFIELIVDLDKVEDVFDFEIKSYWKNYAKKEGLVSTSYLSSLGNNQERTNEKELVENDLNLNYKNLPSKYKGKKIEQITYGDESGNYKYVKTISVSRNITQPTQKEYYEII